jgi:hypothetical protein
VGATNRERIAWALGFPILNLAKVWEREEKREEERGNKDLFNSLW